MGRSSRRMRRARARGMRPTMREIAPGVWDVAFPVPPGASPDEVRELAARAREIVRELYGQDPGELHVCTPETCSHLPNPTPTHEQE